MMSTFTAATPATYDLKVTVENEKATYSVKCPSGGGFGVACRSRGPKIYLLACDDLLGSVVYVGKTVESIPARFARSIGECGEEAKGHRYRWGVEPGEYLLFVWDLKPLQEDDEFLCAIEAEVVFAVRAIQKGWPTFQRGLTLFHFMHRECFQESYAIARKIIGQYFDALAARPGKSKDASILAERARALALITSLAIF